MTVLTFSGQQERIWRIIEIKPGVWRGELHRRGAGIVTRTEEGCYVDVRDCVEKHRDALPIRVRHLRHVNGRSW